jgi:membrane-bound lytic murein transglycosylase D
LTTIQAIPPDMRVWWRYHNVAPGDTLASVAKAYHSNRKTIAEANGLGEDDQLTPESKLIIPVTPGKHPSSEGEATYARYATRYKVRSGDTVESVAENFGVPAAMVRRWNHLKGDSLRGRRVLYVRLPVTPNFAEKQPAGATKSKSKKTLHATGAKNPVRHKVEPGETLYSIAKSHNTTVAALKQQNGNLATLKPGMILLIQSGR